MTPRTPKPISDLIARAQADLELVRADESSAQEMLNEATRRRTQIEGFLSRIIHSSHGPIMQRADKLLVLTGQEILA